MNKKGERLTYPLGSALESSNVEMTKRLKYTKDILTHMLNNHGNTGTAASSGGGTGSVSKQASSKGFQAYNTAKADGKQSAISPRTGTASAGGAGTLSAAGAERKFYATNYNKK